jgi:autotransporter translocation and assembly factor TamB
MKTTMLSKRMVALAIIAVVVICVVVFRGPILRVGAADILGAATGTKVSFGSIALHGGHATLTNVRMSAHGGEPLAYVPRIDVAYNLRELLPGSNHRFGLHAITVYRPRITVVHNPDGSYNLPKMPKGGPSNKQAAPMNMTLRVIDGSLAVLDRTRIDPSARRLYIGNVNFNADVHTNSRTRYTSSMAYVVGGRTYPIRGRGVIDTPAGFTLHHWTAAHIPLTQLVNYELNNANLRMRAGYLDNLDARYYAGGISASAYMGGGVIAMQGASAPINNVHGSMEVTSAGLTTPRITADVAGAPVYITGGIYDLKAPKFRLALQAHSDISRIKRLASAAAKLPMRGPIDMAMLVEGPVRTPIAFISLRSPRIDYRAMPLRDAEGTLAFDGKTANVLHFALRYAGFNLAARGRMSLQNGPNAVEAVASLKGPSNEIPFASAIVPNMPLEGLLLASGDTLKRIDTHGVLGGNGSGTQLGSVFHVSSAGVGTVDFALANSLVARIALDHPHNKIAALVHANDLAVRPAQVASLPGFNVKAPPPVRATIAGDIFATQQNKQLGMAGNVHVRDASFGSMSIARADARFAGAPGNIGVSSLAARGSFGTLDAKGSITGSNHVALEGRFSGSLAALGAVAGHLPATGRVDAPIALVYNGGVSIAQIRDARFTGASIRGVPINGLSATIGTQGKNLRVYAARATIAQSGSAVAAGSVGARDSKLALSISHLNLGAMHGTPLRGGYANLAATAAGSLKSPSVNGAMLVDRAQYGHYRVMGDAAFAYGGDTFAVRDAMIGLGPALVAVDGTVGGVRIGAPMMPQYDLNASLRAADAHALVAFTQPKLARQYIEGSIDANVHVGGAGRTPMVSGAFDVPAGSVHGLAFRNLRGTLDGTSQNFSVNGGHVTIGSTAVAFNAAVARNAMRAGISAPDANLADFNDYFDTGDTFAGTGKLAMNVAMAGGSIASSGNVDLAAVRFHRFDIGNTVANWRTDGHTVAMTADVGGNAGRAHLTGHVVVPHFGSVAQLATASDLDLAGSVRGVDLGTWLPLMGMTAPVTGFLDADATVRGHYPDVSLAARANVVNGVVGRVQLQQAQVALTADRGRGQIQQAVVRIPYLTANGSGSFGLHKNDPLQVAMHATSPDLGKLMNSVSGKKFDASGTLDTTMRVTGTRADPQIRDDFTLASLRYSKFTVPKVWGTVTGNARTVALQHGEVDLKRGRVLVASGTAPLHLRRNAPVVFDMDLDNVDFSDFDSAFPKGYHLAGTMGGALHIRGTMDAPQLNGAIALHNGYFVGPIDQNPIQKINGTLAFAGNTIAIRALHADVGGGTMDMNATATVPNFRNPKAATFTSTIVANNAQFNSPQYFRGKVNANIAAFRNTGGIPTINGSVNIPSARIPLTAFWNPRAPKASPKPPMPLAFNLRATVGNDVRVQSTGVDVPAQGAVTVAGTLAHPTLNGNFTSTGGTISFLRRFDINNASVAFNPSNGIMPTVDATATTQVTNPAAYIAMHVTGLAPSNLNIAFDSEPPYSREQILAMLSGINNLNGTGGATLASAGGGGDIISHLATGQLNGFFTSSVLQPLSASLGNALGLQNLQLTDDFTSGFGVNAAKAFGKHITAVYSANLGVPQRRSLSIEAHHGESTAFNLMFYSVDSPPLLAANTQTNLFGFNDLSNSTVLTPLIGTNGYTLMYEHKFI